MQYSQPLRTPPFRVDSDPAGDSTRISVSAGRSAYLRGYLRSDSAEKFEKVCSILNRFGRRPSGLIPILQAIQHEYQYLPEEVLTYVATSDRIARKNSRRYAVFSTASDAALQG